MYKAALFDMDGTVLDTLTDLANAMNYSLKAAGLPQRSREEIRACVGNGPIRFVKGAVPEGTAPELETLVLEYYKPYYDKHCQEETAPYPGIIKLMEALKARGIKLAVISNKQESAVKMLAEHYFPGLLEQAVGVNDKIACKPDPSAILAAMEQLGVEKSETVYVGDMDVDMMAAKNAGIDCATVSWGFLGRARLEALGAELIVDTAEELLEFVTG